MSYGLSIQSFEGVHTTMYVAMKQKAIILIMRYGFIALEARSVEFICRSTGTSKLKNRIRYKHLVERRNMKLRGIYTLLQVERKFK
jgi:hypothetical protein